MRFNDHNHQANNVLVHLFKLRSQINNYGKATPTPVYIGQHPFIDMAAVDTFFVGELGITSSVDTLFQVIMKKIVDTDILSGFTWYFCDVLNNGGDVMGHDIYLEAQFSWLKDGKDRGDIIEVFICGGMTDFSGTGSAGYERARAVVNFLCGVLGCDQRSAERNAEQREKAENIINEAKSKVMAE